MKRDLKSELWKPEYDIHEFCEVLQTHYTRSHSSTQELALGIHDEPSLVLNWTSRGKLKGIIPGKSFDPADIRILQDKIARALRESSPAFWRVVAFSLRPLQGALGLEEWFQWLPAPPQAPQPKSGSGGHVSILEIRVDGSSDGFITARRASKVAREIELLLAALLKDDFVLNTRPSQSHWFVVPPENTHLYGQTHYSWPEFDKKISQFSDISQVDDVGLVEPSEYYDDFSGPRSMNISIPTSLPSLLFRYRGMNEKGKRQFLRGAYWFQNSRLVAPISQSAAFAAMVRAIEALMPPVIPTSRCQLCGMESKPAIRTQFSAFVDNLVAGAISEERRLAFYDRRSRLVHGDQLFSSDEDLWMMSGPRHLDELGEMMNLTSLTRMVFHNWLLDKGH